MRNTHAFPTAKWCSMNSARWTCSQLEALEISIWPLHIESLNWFLNFAHKDGEKFECLQWSARTQIAFDIFQRFFSVHENDSAPLFSEHAEQTRSLSVNLTLKSKKRVALNFEL